MIEELYIDKTFTKGIRSIAPPVDDTFRGEPMDP